MSEMDPEKVQELEGECLNRLIGKALKELEQNVLAEASRQQRLGFFTRARSLVEVSVHLNDAWKAEEKTAPHGHPEVN